MMGAPTIACFAAALALAGAGGAAGQQPPIAEQPAATGQPAGVPPAPQAPGPKPAYSYDPAGRRDPFVSLLGRGADPRSMASRPAGLGGILINEINLKGIMRDRTGFVALVLGPDSKTYFVKPGDRLMDGTVKSILSDAVVFSQDVNDPLSLVKVKEVRKGLRASDDVKQ